MMHKRQATFVPTRLALVASVLSVALAQAQQPDTTNWRCQRCPFKTGGSGETVVGSSYVSDDETRYGNATGYDDRGIYLNASGIGDYAGDSQRLSVDYRDLGLNSRFAQLRGARRGGFEYTASYRERPWRRFDSTKSPYAGRDADGVLRLPAGWQSAPTTSGFTGLPGNLRRADIEFDRQEIVLGAAYRLSARYQLYSKFRHESSDGQLIRGAANFSQAAELPHQVKFSTDEFDAGIRYRGERGAFELAYRGSYFDNRNSLLQWENAFAALPGAEIGAAAEAPDNVSHTLSMSGRWSGPFKTVASIAASLSRLEQDEQFVRSTVNPNIPTTPLPRSTLDGQVDLEHLAIRLSSRPVSFARFSLDLSSTERNNRTSQAAWERIVVDSFSSGESELNPAYDYARRRLKLRADADITDHLRLTAGYSFTETKRNLQEVAQQEEGNGWGQLRWRPAFFLETVVKAGSAQRDIDEYADQIATDLGQNPLLRKFNLAQRDRDYAELQLTATLPKTPVSVTAMAKITQDDYTESALGLTDSEEQSINLDLSWSVSDTTVLYMTGGYRSIDSIQIGSQTFSAPRWRARHDDKFSSFGGGFRVEELFKYLELSADLQIARGDTAIAVAVNGAALDSLPDLEADEASLKVRATYSRTENLALIFEIDYTQLETKDWALSGIGPTSAPALLSLGAANYDYDVLRVGIGARYQFGD